MQNNQILTFKLSKSFHFSYIIWFLSAFAVSSFLLFIYFQNKREFGISINLTLCFSIIFYLLSFLIFYKYFKTKNYKVKIVNNELIQYIQDKEIARVKIEDIIEIYKKLRYIFSFPVLNILGIVLSYDLKTKTQFSFLTLPVEKKLILALKKFNPKIQIDNDLVGVISKKEARLLGIKEDIFRKLGLIFIFIIILGAIIVAHLIVKDKI